MAYPDINAAPALGAVGEDSPFAVGMGANDPYRQMMLKRWMMAQALAEENEPRQPMTHWTQVLGHIANKGVGAWKASKAEKDMLDYSKKQREYFSNATRGLFADILRGGDDNTAPAPMPQSAPATPAAAPRASAVTPQGFVQQYAPLAQKVAQETGLDPRLVLAQSGLETGWGAKAPGNNYFGLKGSGQNLATTEVVDGQAVPQQANFRAYGSPEDSFSDYAKFIQGNPRYAPVLQAQGLDEQIKAMGASGYATDPQYGQKLAMLARGIQMPGSAPPTAPVQMAQAGPQTATDGAPGGLQMAPQPGVAYPGARPGGQPQLTPQQMMQLRIAALKGQGGDLIGALTGATNALYPEPKFQAVRPGETIVDTRSKRVIYQAPQLPDRELVKIDQPDGGYLMVPRSQAARMTGAPPVSPRPQLLPPEVLAQQSQLARDRADRSVVQTGENKLQSMTVEDFRKAQNTEIEIAKRSKLFDRMESAISRFPPGKDAPLRLWAGQIGNVFGIKTAGLSEGETAQMIASRLAIEAAPKGQGQVSNYERSLFAGALPQMTTTLEGTRKAIQVIRDLDSIDAGVAKIYRENARKHGGLPDPISVAEEIAAFTSERSGAIQEALAPYAQSDAAPSKPALRWNIEKGAWE